MIGENFGMACLVRASDEDFKTMFNITDAHDAYKLITKTGNATLIYTRGDKPTGVLNATLNLQFPVTPIKVKSTVGAGDNFNAGIILSLFEQNIGRGDISSLEIPQWKKIIDIGTALSAGVCQSYENYISKEFARKFIK